MSEQQGPSVGHNNNVLGQTAHSPSYWKFWTWHWTSTPSTSSQPIVDPIVNSSQTPPIVQSSSGQLPIQQEQPAETTVVLTNQPSSSPQSWEQGWERIKSIYTSPISMERDVTERVVRMTFFGGFMMGGASGYASAQKVYEGNNVGRKYLSPSDAVKRRVDYAIVRFAKGGMTMGFKCALISGSIVVLTTHVSAFRDRFSSLYLPALSGALAVCLHTALVGSVFTFPLGPIGMAKAAGLGLSSGLTLSAVVQLYAMSLDKDSNRAYWQFKHDYEKELKVAKEWDSRVTELMEAEGLKWRQTAVKKLKQMDEEALRKQDA